MNQLTTMYTMHGAGRKLTRTEMILAIEAAKDAAITAFRADPEPRGSGYMANERLNALKSLGPIRSVWRHVFQQAAKTLGTHAYCVNLDARRQCLDAATKLEEATKTLDALFDDLLVEHGV